jgi:hypothetical protein
MGVDDIFFRRSEGLRFFLLMEDDCPLPVNDDDDDNDGNGAPLVALQFTGRIPQINNDNDDNDDDDDATRPAAMSRDDVMEQDPGDIAANLMRMMLHEASSLIPFICVDMLHGRKVASVRNGLATATFCQIAKYLHTAAEDDTSILDLTWAARLVAYTCSRTHHGIPVPRADGAVEIFHDYSGRLDRFNVAVDLLIRKHPQCCVVIQEDWPQNPGLGRVCVYSSMDRQRPIWGVLSRFFRLLRPNAPFYDAEDVSTSLRDSPNLLACWGEIQQELNAQRVQAQNRI